MNEDSSSWNLDPSRLTPMMEQYLEAKKVYPEALLLFRLGDFYEVFLDDAIETAALLNLTLTSRNKNDPNPIPMAGIPHHALDNYLPRLLAKRKKVAICDQVEDPKDAVGLVKREVVRIITPGVVLDEKILDQKAPNWLVAFVINERGMALSWLDASTGQRHMTEVRDLEHGKRLLLGLEPAELLMEESQRALLPELSKMLPQTALTLRPPLEESGLSPLETAARQCVAYLRFLYRKGNISLRPLKTVPLGEFMELPPSTLKNLELFYNNADGSKERSLFSILDLCQTAMGSRLLRSRLQSPLLEKSQIEARLNCVEAALSAPTERKALRLLLRGLLDLERFTSRLLNRSVSPKDLVALALALDKLPLIKAELERTGQRALEELSKALLPQDEILQLIRESLVEDPPASLKDGGVIRRGANAELDHYMDIAEKGKSWFMDYAESLREETGISSLKVKFNNVYGYFLEVTKANLHMVPDDWFRKQTLVNSERYFTEELKEWEGDVLHAEEKRLALELALFDALVTALLPFSKVLYDLGEHLADLDVHLALSELAAKENYARPEIIDAPERPHHMLLSQARHPMVERALPTGEFVPNDLALDSLNRLVILTAPNMAGKSTVMRQTAIIAIMAQMGSFVPAESASLSIVDKLFTRVGASDDLARGQSTFMVEMTEAAEILDMATSRSLVILDELGRGTSTWDGLSIAWAVAEYIHDKSQCRCLFASHYHELTSLSDTREAVKNMSLAIRESKGDILFLRRLIDGGSNRSYGIQVAKLAGLPKSVLERANEVLENLEAMAVDPDSHPRIARGQATFMPAQLSLFTPASQSSHAAKDPIREAKVKKMKDRLNQLSPDDLSPKEALDLLYDLRAAWNDLQEESES